jgi:uncharacterized protein (UPF0147 family)
MEGHGEKLTQKKEQAIIALLTSPSITAAAKQADIGETTLYRWLKESEFKAQYNEAKRELLSQAVSKLQQNSAEAVEVLREVANDKEAPASSRVTAAKTTIEMALKSAELEDIVQRIEQLERMADQK